MRATGVVRRIDDLGRIAIPKEVRRTLCIKEGDPLELWVDGNNIVFTKYNDGRIDNRCNEILDILEESDSVCTVEQAKDIRTHIEAIKKIYKESR